MALWGQKQFSAGFRNWKSREKSVCSALHCSVEGELEAGATQPVSASWRKYYAKN